MFGDRFEHRWINTVLRSQKLKQGTVNTIKYGHDYKNAPHITVFNRTSAEALISVRFGMGFKHSGLSLVATEFVISDTGVRRGSESELVA